MPDLAADDTATPGCRTVALREAQFMAANWESKLEKLKRDLDAYWKFANTDLDYGVVHIRGQHVPDEVPLSPIIYAAGGPLVESVIVPLSPDEHQLHLVFARDHSEENRRALKLFKSQLSGFRDIVTAIPQRVLPQPQVPSMGPRADEDFVRWGLGLIWLGATEQNVFHNEVEYALTTSTFWEARKVTSWEEFSPVSGFDPIAMLTLTESSDRGWTYWNEGHTKDGRPFPEVWTASLTKPLFYASINAIDLLLQRGRELRPAPKKVKVPDRRLQDGTVLDPTAALVLGELRRHHGTQESPCFDPITQGKIAKKLNVSQSTVGRALGRLLKNISYGKDSKLTVAERYANLCKQKMIVGVLDHIENPRLRNELTSIELNFLESDNRRY